MADTVSCAGCQCRWMPEDVSVPGACPACGQHASVVERCDSCPVVEVEQYRRGSATGLWLDRVLEHEFDCKHYEIDPGAVPADVREGLKIMESERARWERETREKQQEEFEETQRIREMQRKAGRGF